jgi:hypothetical protein
MKTLLLTLLLATLCAATGYGQTVKSLSFNTTNGEVAANTGTNVLTFTNEFINLYSSLRGYDNTNTFIVVNTGEFFGTWYFDEAINFGNAAATRTNLGLGGGLTTNVVVDTNTLVFTNGILVEVQ